MLTIKGEPLAKSRRVNLGVDAHTQTSYDQTFFPIGMAMLTKFNDSFSDISAAMSYSGDEMIFDDPSMMSRSPSSIANFMRNFEISVPGPSRGDRGSLMICCVCHRVYPEDHRVTCRWCGKQLCFYRCAGPHARYYCRNHPDRRSFE